jgi:hypothetical protein
MTGASAETSTVSRASPGRSVRSTFCGSATVTGTSATAAVANPALEAVTR